MIPRRRIRGRARIEQEIEENGLAIFAVHREPFQLLVLWTRLIKTFRDFARAF
jgi:TRAP-type uncharacterized transport system substrate-binding protein